MNRYNINKILNDLAYYSALFFAVLVVLILIILVKSDTQTVFSVNPFIAIFALFTTVFQLSRLTSAAMFSFNKNIKNKTNEIYQPDITFVIPCKNEEKCIADNISKCFESDYPKDKIEVIVVNDGSTDGTIRVLNGLVHKYDSRLVIVDWRENKGKRHGMAEGFRMAKGEIVIQLDSDSYIEPKSIQNLINPFIDKEIGAVCAHADPQNADVNLITRMQSAYYFMSFRILKAAESNFNSVFCCSGCSSAYRKDIVLPILDMWLDESFLGAKVTWGDDRSLTSWILKLGYKTIYTNDVQAYTIVPQNWSQLYTQQLRWKKSWIINSFFTSKFIYRTNPFIAFFYFYPLVIIGFATPIIALLSLVYFPIVSYYIPYLYIISVLLMTSLFILFYRIVKRENKYWPYLYLWALFNIFFLSYVMFIAIIKIQDRGWGTR